MFVWKAVALAARTDVRLFFARVLVSPSMDVDVATAKLARPIEPQEPHLCKTCQVEINWNFLLIQPWLNETITCSNKIWVRIHSFANTGPVFLNKNQEKQGNSLQQLFFCIVPRSYPPGWTVSRGKDLLWSVGNVNTLSDLRLYPDVPHVNISKYRLRLRSQVAQHTYIYYVCMPKHTCAHMAGAPDVIDGSHLCFGGFVLDLWPSEYLRGSEIHCLAWHGSQNT